ncbi:MAG TPA: lipopolysaccharide kinase InaA family protein [Pseudonocardiaceae bacterium]
MTTAEALAAVRAARTPADLFGPDHDVRRYRRLARLVHPDTGGTAAAFARLDEFWRAGAPAAGTVTVRTRRHSYELGAPFARGDLATLYRSGPHLVKLARDPAANDLMDREARALRRLAADGDERFRPYVPGFVEAFTHRDARTGARRRTVVTRYVPGLRSLAEVHAAYPEGLDPRDAAWMWRRLLVALGLAHRCGLVHGAVLPEHVLIHPGEHGLVLVDWCHSTDLGATVPAMVAGRASWYPAEVAGRAPAGPATDLAMAARCMAYLMGDRAPRPLRLFLRGCLAVNPAHRPQDAWRLLAELDELLGRRYGPRRFRPFHLPAADRGHH